MLRHGNETVEGYGLSDNWIVGPCETCEGTGKLTKRHHNRKTRTDLVDPQEGTDWLGDDGSGETSEALTKLNDPKYRDPIQADWGDYANQIEHWPIATYSVGLRESDTAYDAFSLDIAATKLNADAAEWLKLHEVDDLSYEKIAEKAKVPKTTIYRRIAKLKATLRHDQRFAQFVVTRLKACATVSGKLGRTASPGSI